MSKINVSNDNSFGVIVFCIILFTNFDDAKYDLYDAIMQWLLK